MIERRFDGGWLGFLGFLGFMYFETGNPLHLIPFGCFAFFLLFINDIKRKLKKT